MKTQHTRTVRWFFVLALLGILVMASCNRSATQGILPDDIVFNENTENTGEDSVETDNNIESPNTTVEALLEDDLDESGEGVEEGLLTEESAPADQENDDTEQLANEGDTTSEPLASEDADAEAGEELAATESDTTNDGSELTIQAPVIGNVPATYIVQDGDWVYKIARTFNIAPLDLLAANPVIGADQQVYPGQELIIPDGNLESVGTEQGSVEGANIISPANAVPASTYEVQTGDTVFSIAVKHGITVDTLAEHNDIEAPYMIYVGQSVTIPAQ